MRSPPRDEEEKLHERVLSGDPLASEAVFMAFMEPLTKMVMWKMRCKQEDAYDAMVDAVFIYLNEPERYDPKKASLTTFLGMMAKRRLSDKRDSERNQAEREKKYAAQFELLARNPKEVMEAEVEAKRAVESLVKGGYMKNDQDWTALELILSGERSTEVLAKALGLGDLPKDEMKRAVKRVRDRLMKLLERIGKKTKEEPDDEP